MNLLKTIYGKLRDLVTKIVNEFFSFTTVAAGRRTLLLITALFATYFGSMLIITPPTEIGDAYSKFISGEMGAANFLSYMLWVVINADIIRILIVIVFPFWAARRIAGIYLADIFEREASVGRDFIWRAAFATSFDTIHINTGKVIEADQDSPILQIGGPGLVQVELDSAILTERADGTHRIIGPTQNLKGSVAVLDGFERIRQGVDLRDQAQSKDGKGMDVSVRTRDGLLVTAKDIKFVFSIRRRPNMKDKDDEAHVNPPDAPYPFAPSAVRKQVFDQVRSVAKDKDPERKPDWQKPPLPAPIGGMVGGKLGGFISGNGLGEFLAFIGEPELSRLRDRWDEVYRASEVVTGIPQDKDGNVPDQPKYIPRDRFTKLFDEEAGFASAAEGRGIELRWIGVGTWDTPQPSISEKHREAWLLSRENVRLGGPGNLNERLNTSRQIEQLRLIREMPLEVFYEITEQDRTFDYVVRKLLVDYHNRLKLGKQEYERQGEEVPQTVQNAIDILDRIQRDRGWNIYNFGV